MNRAERGRTAAGRRDRDAPDGAHLRTGTLATPKPGRAAPASARLSRALLDGRDPGSAVGELDRAIRDTPGVAGLHRLRGLLKQRCRDAPGAQADLRRAIELDPSDPVGYLDMGNFLVATGRPVEAVLFLEHLLRLQPAMTEGYARLAEAHRQLGHASVAIALLDRACELAPERIDLGWLACWSRMQACAWQDQAGRIADLRGRAIAAGRTIPPFVVMALGFPDAETLLWSRAWAEETMPAATVPVPGRRAGAPLRSADGRIRLGYLSADFHGHATASLVSELFRLQDRTRFALIGYNIGRRDGSRLGHDMISSLDGLVDLQDLDDRGAAERIAADGIAVLLDLKGFTTDSRPGILAHRPAPIQVNYLGYPGSMGTPFIDYVLADGVVVPDAARHLFDEAVVHLPHSYQPNDRSRPGADAEARRELHGLPATGFVFCCFNSAHKLTPLVFALWMRLLGGCPGAVLWLLGGDDLAEANLRAAAEAEGIAPDRLVFARPIHYAAHLARLGLADLVLDTLPVNAHTTASEALWCGVPVLTCMGSQFTGRVAASLLTAIGLPELITTSLPAYEREALALARDPRRLGALRDRLAVNRATMPLFDTPRYVKHYEAALERMVERWEAGLPPAAFAIEDAGREPLPGAAGPAGGARGPGLRQEQG